MTADPIICDTPVWLYAGRIGHIELLHQLYDSVLTTETVCWELDNGRLSRPDTPDVRTIPWVRIVKPDLQALEKLPVNRLGLSVIGTLGVLLKAKQAGLIPAVRPLLEMLQLEGFYVSDALLHFALVRANGARPLLDSTSLYYCWICHLFKCGCSIRGLHQRQSRSAVTRLMPIAVTKSTRSAGHECQAPRPMPRAKRLVHSRLAGCHIGQPYLVCIAVDAGTIADIKEKRAVVVDRACNLYFL